MLAFDPASYFGSVAREGTGLDINNVSRLVLVKIRRYVFEIRAHALSMYFLRKQELINEFVNMLFPMFICEFHSL